MSGFVGSWRRSNSRVGAAMGRCAREGKTDTRRWTRREAKAQTRAREDGGGLVQELAEGPGGARAMRGAQRRQGDLQLVGGDLDVAGGGEKLVQQRSAAYASATASAAQYWYTASPPTTITR